MLHGLSVRPTGPHTAMRFAAAEPVNVPYQGVDTRSGIVRNIPEPLMPYMQAVENGADGVELDVRPFDENTFTMREAGNGKTSFSYKGKTVPSLKDVLEILPKDMEIFLEVKSAKVFLPSRKLKLEKMVVEFIRENNLFDRVTVIGFSPLILRKIEKMDPRIKTGMRWVFPRHHHATAAMFDKAHRNGQMAVPWVSGNHRGEESARFDMYVDDGADGSVTNAPDVLREKAGRKTKGVQFSGTIGKNDLQNLLAPDFLLRWHFKHREAGALWKKESARFQKLDASLRANGLDDQTILEMHAFSERAMRFPEGFHLGMGDEAFKAYYANLDDTAKERVKYSLDRYAMFVIDHYASVFETVENREQWKTVEWFLNGLLAHPANEDLFFTAMPLGLVTRPIAQMLDAKKEYGNSEASPYWQAFKETVAYGQAVIDEAFSGEAGILRKRSGDYVSTGETATPAQRQQAAQKEQERFACDVIYPLIKTMPNAFDSNDAVGRFMIESLPEIFETFMENYPPPQYLLLDDAGDVQGGHPDYFEKLQKHIIQNAMMLLQHSDRLAREPRRLYPPDGPRPPKVIQHTGLNHLAYPGKPEEGGR